MRQLAAATAMSLDLARDATADDRRRADEWRALHCRPDALPDPVEPVRPSRRLRVSGFVVRLRHAGGAQG